MIFSNNFPRLLALALLCLCSCVPDGGSPKAGIDDFFEMEIGRTKFKARLAVSAQEQMKGLMFVESMPEDEGMLFVYDSPQRLSFWMKNTLIPLDLAFFDKDLKLLEVKRLYPRNLDSVNSASSDVFYALEMNAEWFAKNGIAPGAKLDKALFDKALKARTAK